MHDNVEFEMTVPCYYPCSPVSHQSNPPAGGAMDTNTRTILVIDDNLPAIAERMATTTARLEADFSEVETKIHRFPGSLRGIGGDNGRYVVPSVVAIGPYHHGAPHLQKMEEVKLAAAYYLCRASGRSTDQVYEKVRSVAGAARGCYDADDPAVVGLGDAQFAAMMFLDGCFLLQYMVAGGDADDDDATPPVLQNRMTLSTGPSIQKDIFLLENQIPWLVLDALAEFMFVDVRGFVVGMGDKFLPWKGRMKKKPKDDGRRCCRRGMHCGSCIPTTTALAKTDEESRGVGSSSTEQHKAAAAAASPRSPQVHSDELHACSGEELQGRVVVVVEQRRGARGDGRRPDAEHGGLVRGHEPPAVLPVRQAVAVAGVPERRHRVLAREHGGAGGEHRRRGEGRHGRLRGELVPVGAGDAHGQEGGRARAPAAGPGARRPEQQAGAGVLQGARPAPALRPPLLRRPGGDRLVQALQVGEDQSLQVRLQ
ncbi:hypothetical protein BDA96_07G022100 [Sorghum bicolor]|uniref:Uncharacterized protein n=1 Tax=Sorghum bicolor TaxID=4558 RepID=A0A921U965_SORBI|nr:hypothetical protein BDA96_07G022100 [Sorghum bicolor]